MSAESGADILRQEAIKGLYQASPDEKAMVAKGVRDEITRRMMAAEAGLRGYDSRQVDNWWTAGRDHVQHLFPELPVLLVNATLFIAEGAVVLEEDDRVHQA